MASEAYHALIDFAKNKGVFRLSEAQEQGIHPEQIRRLYQRGILERVARGTYRLSDGEVSEYQTMVEACARVSHGVVCLLSALRFHELTSQAPFEVWLAIGPDARKPKTETLPIRIVRFSGQSLTAGVETHQTPGGQVRVYGIEKTVADCFKYRNKIGLDVALEALNDAWRSKKLNLDELWRYAKICRVANVMRPYLEMLSA
ncbi:MAG: transcriptional regulator [Candidatus Dadabacteria bacterium]|nr:MAG: transcriptional regulator [Candidatus Dadabacteria bacterium]